MKDVPRTERTRRMPNTEILLQLKSRRQSHESMGHALHNLINILNFQYGIYEVTNVDVRSNKIAVSFTYQNGDLEGEMAILKTRTKN